MITDDALRQFHENFANSPYIGRVQLYDAKETGLGKHRFFYLGHYDVFGVEMPALGRRRGVEFQIWPFSWVKKYIPNIRNLIDEAIEGNYIHIRHNIELEKRAKESGRQLFTKAKHHRTPLTITQADKLPIRGRKRKRKTLKI